MQERRGPTISPQINTWISMGGPFPETFEFRDSKGSNTNYEILDRDDDGYISELKSKTGKKSFVLRVLDPATKRYLAAKFCIAADYQDKSPLTEVELASKLRGGEDFIHLLAAVGTAPAFDSQPPSSEAHWVCFLSDWLDGLTLKDCLESHPDKITPSLVAEICESLILTVLFLERKGYKHDDLHLANVMLVEADPDRLAIDPDLPPHKVKVIDLGSVKSVDKDTHKADDDWSSLAKCMAILHNHLHKNRGVASRHSRFLNLLIELIEAFADSDPGRFFPETSMYIERIREAGRTLTMLPTRGKLKFHPFEAISAEHLASDELLLKLFVDHLPWISMLQNAEPSVLIGPRGCGKSMVFRHLSIRTHVSKLGSDPGILDRLGFFGVYIGCASDLQNDLLWIARVEGRPEKLSTEITTYFNLVLARELLRSLAMCAATPVMTEILGLTAAARSKVSSFIYEQLGSQFGVIRVPGMDPLQACADVIDRLRLQLSREMLDESSTSIKLGPTFIRELCRTARNVIPGLQEWRVAFLLDDYTSHRLSPVIQSILNTVLWQRDDSHVFKISSEPYGFKPDHVDNSRIEANREYVPIDAGQVSIPAENESERRTFIADLLDKRLSAAKYAGTTATLIGESEYKRDTDLAKAIRSTQGNRTGQKHFYFGIHVLANSWTGDVSTILHMVREMFARAKITDTSTLKIPESIQHKSITKVSTALRERVNGYHPFGAEMAGILSSFGELAKKLLIDAPQKNNRKGIVKLHRKYRIEMTLEFGMDLDNELKKLINGDEIIALKQELIRRAIFIELPPSRGKESAGSQTVRWQLRSSLLPSFGTSLIREDYIDIKEVQDFAELLTSPQHFASKVYLRYAQQPTAPAPQTQDLFPELKQ